MGRVIRYRIVVSYRKKLNITLHSGGQEKKSGLPNGVIKGKGKLTKTYIAQCFCDKSNTRYIGSFTTVEDAFNAYRETKERLVAKLTFEFLPLLDDETIDQLLSYTPKYEYGDGV